MRAAASSPGATRRALLLALSLFSLGCGKPAPHDVAHDIDPALLTGGWLGEGQDGLVFRPDGTLGFFGPSAEVGDSFRVVGDTLVLITHIESVPSETRHEVTALTDTSLVLVGGGGHAGTYRRALVGLLGTIVLSHEEMVLPIDAVVTVTLEDISRADAPAEVLARRTITRPARVPIPVSLEYPASAIDPSHRYGIRAEIAGASGVLYRTARHYPVITAGDGKIVAVAVEPVK